MCLWTIKVSKVCVVKVTFKKKNRSSLFVPSCVLSIHLVFNISIFHQIVSNLNNNNFDIVNFEFQIAKIIKTSKLITAINYRHNQHPATNKKTDEVLIRELLYKVSTNQYQFNIMVFQSKMISAAVAFALAPSFVDGISVQSENVATESGCF